MTINAFTLKELRQLARTKSISFSLIAFLFVALLIAYAVPVFGGMRQDTGEMMFFGINGLLALMLCVVLPSEVFTFLDKERGSARQQADFTMLTALPPSEVIDGKLRGAFALMALFTTAALPFGVLAYLMHGITFLVMLKMLVLTLCASCVATHLALAIAAMKVPRIVRRCVYAVFMFGVIASGLLVLGGFGADPFVVRAKAFWVIVALAVTVCMVVRGFAISFFAPVVTERDVALRLTVVAAVIGWLAFILASGSMDALLLWVAALTACSFSLAIHSMAQPLGYSRRMLASRPRNLVLRALFFPLSSATVNGFVFACIIGGVAALVTRHILAEEWSATWAGQRWSLATLLMYFYSIMLLARWVWRIFFSRRSSPALVPLMAIGLFAFLQTIPPYIGFDGNIAEFNSTPFYCPGIIAEPHTHLLQSVLAFGFAFGINFVTSIIAAILRARKK